MLVGVHETKSTESPRLTVGNKGKAGKGCLLLVPIRANPLFEPRSRQRGHGEGGGDGGDGGDGENGENGEMEETERWGIEKFKWGSGRDKTP